VVRPDTGDSGTGHEDGDPLRDRLGRALPDYEIAERAAAGGMGVVFRGRDRALDMPVAIKVLRPELATAVGAERFLREARLLAAVNHPSIVTIHKVGDADGLFYFVMEWLDHTLADRLRAGRMGRAEVIRMGRELLDALARVHDREIVHRDIKPSNIFFVEDGRAKLGDFGIARRDRSLEPPLTETGSSHGTPAYMAPEQFVTGDVRPAADLYAMGMVCFEALTGRRWRSSSEPDEEDWTGVRGRMRAVLERALAIDPAERWPDARAFGDALDAVQRPRGRPVLVGTAAVAIAAIGVGVVRGCEPPSAASEVAVLPFAVEGGAARTGGVLAVWVEQTLRHAFGDSGLAVTPEALSGPWADRLAADAALPPAAWDTLRTHRIVRGRVRVVGDSLDVDAALIGRQGDTLTTAHVTSHRADLQGIAHRLGLAVVQVIRPAQAARYVGVEALSDVAAATHALVDAEHAFQRDNWEAADSLYREAITLDSSLALAWWGLFNTRRWQRVPPGVDLAAVYARHAARFDDLERRLIEAELAETVRRRLDIYAAAIREFPWNAYPRLLRGNELFHRGAFVGAGLDSAIAELGRAAEENPYLAATWDMLTWAHTRAGDGARAAAAIEARKRLGLIQPVAGYSIPQVLELAVGMRFLPAEQSARGLKEVQASPDGRASLARAVRLGLSFGIPEAQLEIGRRLALVPDPAFQAQGLATQALAALALGRPAEAVALLEQAARVTRDDEYGFQAAQWCVILPALGLPGILDPRRDSARTRLAKEATGPRAARARWALDVDAIAAGRIPSAAAAGGGTDRLAALGAALGAAARRDTAAALAATDTLLERVLHADLEDPLQRAVLFLARARWLAARAPGAADLALRWYENADFADWPAGPPQAAELDWALEAFARYERARLAHATGQGDLVCTVAPEAIRRWAHAAPSYEPLRRDLATWTATCPGS